MEVGEGAGVGGDPASSTAMGGGRRGGGGERKDFGSCWLVLQHLSGRLGVGGWVYFYFPPPPTLPLEEVWPGVERSRREVFLF